ncbi:MAG: DEAD/DEAH box helicase [Phycisphaerae bacterium]|nr:DEAD/DEAH box helicase [Phycisphaerae bacterium]
MARTDNTISGTIPPNPRPALFDKGLPDTLEEAIVLVYALAFGPVEHSVLAKALTHAGMTLPGGGHITDHEILPYIVNLHKEKLLVSSCQDDVDSDWDDFEPDLEDPACDIQGLECDVDLRWATFDQAQEKGWLVPFGQILQQVDPGEIPETTVEYKWSNQRFVSLAHACRDVFLAMETGNQDALTRLIHLCQQDQYLPNLAHVLSPICIDPLNPDYLSRLDSDIQVKLLYSGLHANVHSLCLSHPIFEYTRSELPTFASGHADSTFSALVAHLAERDLLCGDLSSAEAILKAYPHAASPPLSGMLALFTGHTQAAREAFALAYQAQGKGKKGALDHLSGFPGVLHVTLLVQSDTLQDRTLASTWLNWVEDTYCPFQASFTCLSNLLALNQGAAPDLSESSPIASQTADLEKASFLILFLLQHYCSRSDIPTSEQRYFRDMFNRVLTTFKENHALWPCYQIVTLLDRLDMTCHIPVEEAIQFFETSGLEDLSEVWSPKEIWENQLQALEQLVSQSPGAARPGHPAVRAMRLGWKLKPRWDYDPNTDSGMETQHSPVFAVVPVEQKMTAKGSWTKGREVALNRVKNYRSEGLDYLSDQDVKVAELIQISSNRHYYQPACTLNVSRALQALVGHENVFWEENPLTPVEITASEPQVRILPQGEHLEITLDPMPYEEGMIKTIRILHDAPHRLRTVQFLPMHKKIAEILGRSGIKLPDRDKDKAVERLQGLSRHIAIQSNVAMSADHARTVQSDSRPILRLQRLGQGLQAEMIVLPLGEGSKRSFAPGLGSRHLIDTLNNAPVQTQRDLDLETRYVEQILDQVPILRDFPAADFLWHLDEDPSDALTLLEQLQALPPETLTVLWPKGNPISVRTVSAQQFNLSIRSAKDWFELDGSVRVDEDLVIQMRQLMDYMDQTDSTFIRLSDTQYLSLTRQFRHDLNLLKATGKFKGKGNKLQIHPLAALGLDQWKDAIQSFKADKAFNAHMDRIRALETYHPELPSTLQAELRPYQHDGFVWLARLAQWGVGACLADDMGLGKTVEALAVILLRASQGPTLVVAPTSVCANWISEIQRFAPTLNPIRFGMDDQGKRQEVLDTLKPFDLLVATYTGLQQEAEALAAVRFTTIVLDEAQAIKNPNTKRSQAAMDLQGDFRMVCTGTPIENRLMELWNLSRFINPGLLGSQKHFTDHFVRPIEIRSDALARHTLKSLITPFVLRRTKNQVLEDLPSRTELIRLVALSPEETALHESLRGRALERLERARHKAPGQKHLQVLAELMKLRRCCCNPRLVVPNCGLTGSKLQVFAELVDELRDNHHKALVFSQFVDHLTLLREHLDAQGILYQYLDGQTPPKKRQLAINAFQNGEGDLFLISLKAGGTGLNLTAADYVIHMDPWWNPAVEDQASDRAHRIGQTRPVTIYRLVTQGTIEEKIVELHHQKRDLADSLLQGTDSAHKLTADDLIALLKQS